MSSLGANPKHLALKIKMSPFMLTIKLYPNQNAVSYLQGWRCHQLIRSHLFSCHPPGDRWLRPGPDGLAVDLVTFPGWDRLPPVQDRHLRGSNWKVKSRQCHYKCLTMAVLKRTVHLLLSSLTTWFCEWATVALKIMKWVSELVT